MDGSGSSLTIDFNDASFDDSGVQDQPIPGGVDVDVVFPITDDPSVVARGADNRNDINNPAQAVALMPSDSVASMMDEFVFEFDNDENDDGDTTTTDQGLKITSKADGPTNQILELNLEGTFENLHDGGTLDIHTAVNDPDSGGKIYEMMTLGMSDSNDGTMGSVVGGDMNGGNMGGGNDTAVINVDATTAIQGMYKGGSGYDALQLVEGVRSDNGAIVDLIAGTEGGNSAYVLPLSNQSSDVLFEIAEWESIQLTNNADLVLIGSTTGANLTDTYNTAYWNPGASNSMLKLQTGYTDGGAADIVKVNADSDLYMSFEFANDSDVGIEATFYASKGESFVDIDGLGGNKESPTIDVEVEQTGGSGMTIDYLEATSNKDTITNESDIGVMVDLGGSTGDMDKFRGSDTSQNDVLDARVTSDLNFSEGGNWIKVTTDNNSVNAKLRDVDYIMTTDEGSDVDFYEDMSDLNGTQLVDGLGAGASDAYGVGYDVITSAQVDKFGTGDPYDTENLRVYYEGDHNDFSDIDDDMTYSDGVFTMSDGDSSRGSTWESEIVTQYGPGQDPGFYVEVSGKKLAVTFDDEKGSWKVDSSAIQVAEDAGSNISTSSIADNSQFASDVMARFGLNPAAPEDTQSSSTTTTQTVIQPAGFPVVNFSGPLISGTIGHNGTNLVLDMTYGNYTVNQMEHNSISEVELFMKNAHNISANSLTVTSTEDASPVFDGISWPSQADWNTYLSDNNSGGGEGGSITTPPTAPTTADMENKVDDVVASIVNDNSDGAGFAKLVDELATMMNDGAIQVLPGKGGYGLIQSPNETAADITLMDVSVLSSMLQAMSPAQQDEIYNKLSGNDAIIDMSGIVSGSGIDVDDNASELGMFAAMSSQEQKAVMAFSDVTDFSSVVSNIYSVYNGQTGSNYSLSNDIYLNASEEAITELLDNGSVSDKAFNFSFYTKMDLVTDTGNVTVNVKLQEDGGNQFSIDADDIDVAVESFYNVADDAGAAVTSSSAAGEFVKIDDAGDIALGNGGDDTYVVGDDGGDIYGGIALEYGNLNQYGGLNGSVDAVNFNSVDSVSELTFRRDELRNEEDGSSLFIGDGSGNETVLFDNYNEYLDFRRVEYLTIEDGANNDEIYEIVTNSNDNIEDWDNEIYVANGGSMDVELGGIDYVVGSDDADTFNVSLSDMMSAGSGTVNLSNVTSDDTINVTDAGSYISTEDEAALETILAQGIAAGGGQVEFSSSEAGLSIKVDSLGIDDTYNIYDYD